MTLSLAAALATYRLARTLGASEPFAAVSGASWALAAPAIYFAHRGLGASYLHRRVRLYHGTPPESGFYNYAIAAAGSGLPAVAVDGDMELVKIPQVTRCARDPRNNWGLH